jgi:hypothetical protein
VLKAAAGCGRVGGCHPGGMGGANDCRGGGVHPGGIGGMMEHVSFVRSTRGLSISLSKAIALPWFVMMARFNSRHHYRPVKK